MTQHIPNNATGYHRSEKSIAELAVTRPVEAGQYVAMHSRGATWFSYLVTSYDSGWGLMLAPDDRPGAHTDAQQYVVVDDTARAPRAVGLRVYIAVEGNHPYSSLGTYVLAVVSDNGDVLALRGWEK